MRPQMRSHRLPIVLLVILAFAAGSVPVLAQQSLPSGVSAQPLIPQQTTELDAIKDGNPAEVEMGGNLVSVIVKLDDAPLASYGGGVPGLAATSPHATGAAQLDAQSAEARRYLDYLDQRQRDFAAITSTRLPQARITASYRHVFGGAALLVPADQVDQVAQLPGVTGVYRGQWHQLTTDRSPQFIGAPTIWRALGGRNEAGEGVVVGVIDSGIWPEHPSFADDGSYPPPPASWGGACEAPLDSSPPITCTNKLIGARAFLETYKGAAGLGPGEYDSPRDDDGHGTHTASTAAGNSGVAAEIYGISRGTISGIAPRAHVAAYKACGAIGCATADLVEAIDQAVADGVDVINYSISGGTNPYGEPTELAFLDAYAAGVFVAASGGNSGPDPSTVAHRGGWVTTVAASTTDRHFLSRLTLRTVSETLTLEGASITAGVPDFAPVVLSSSLGNRFCGTPLAAGSVAGKIVACERGGDIGRIEKGYNVLQGGAVGLILYNPSLADIETDNHWLPTVHLADGTQFLAFMRRGAVEARFTQGAPSEVRGDVVAAFSSRGPTPSGGLIKPDITAPGVQILAGNTPGPREDATLGPPGELFQAIAGTSMSSPHVAGAAALLKDLHPDWTPGQIKSALMTTAMFEDVVKEDETTPADPFDVGSGRVDLTKAGNPGLTFDVTAEQYASGATHQWDLNYPSISIPAMPGRLTVVRTARSELNQNSTWTVRTSAPEGVTITVNPPRLVVPARGYASFTVTIEAKNLPVGTYFGDVTLTRGAARVRLPVAFTRVQPSVALAKTCTPDMIRLRATTDCTIQVSNNSGGTAQVSVRDDVPRGLTVVPGSVHGADVDGNLLTFNGRVMAPSTSTVEVTTTTQAPYGYLPLASLGIPPLTGVCASCDEAAVTFDVDPFTYGGLTYSRVTMVSNGYLVVGNTFAVAFLNQRFPNVSAPNNVIAPYWADLDPDGDAPNDGGAGTWSAAFVTAGTSRWFVAEWTGVARFNAPGTAHSFQIWITLGAEEAFMTYGPNTATEPRMTVGAENFNGTVGDNQYVDLSSNAADGQGIPPVEGTELLVETAGDPGGHTITYQLRGARRGTYLNTAELTSPTFLGVNLASEEIMVSWR